MQYTILGRTNLKVSRSSFGALPIQRLTVEEAGRLLRKAYEGGINFFDTARSYTDSEKKMGLAFEGIRRQIIIATKTPSTTPEGFISDLEKSLENLKTDYIDIYQFHNPSEVPLSGSPLYDCMLKAKKDGKIRFIGITAHRLDNAAKAAESGLYDTIQFPLSALSSDKEIQFAQDCAGKNIGVIAMKALCGGLLPSASLSMAYLRHMEHVVPIWGFQKEAEIDEVLSLEQNPPLYDKAMKMRISQERTALGGDFCRGCGYCQPCAAGIEIQTCARMPFLLRRAVWQNFVTPQWQENMKRIENCIDCGQCHARCPYELDCPSLLRAALKDYNEFIKENGVNEQK